MPKASDSVFDLKEFVHCLPAKGRSCADKVHMSVVLEIFDKNEVTNVVMYDILFALKYCAKSDRTKAGPVEISEAGAGDKKEPPERFFSHTLCGRRADD